MTLTMKLGDSRHPYDASWVGHRFDYRFCPNAIWRRPGVVQGRLHHCGDSTIRDHGHYFITVLLQGLAANSFFSVCVLQYQWFASSGRTSFIPPSNSMVSDPWGNFWADKKLSTALNLSLNITCTKDTITCGTLGAEVPEHFQNSLWCVKNSFALILNYKTLKNEIGLVIRPELLVVSVSVEDCEVDISQRLVGMPQGSFENRVTPKPTS